MRAQATIVVDRPAAREGARGVDRPHAPEIGSQPVEHGEDRGPLQWPAPRCLASVKQGEHRHAGGGPSRRRRTPSGCSPRSRARTSCAACRHPEPNQTTCRAPSRRWRRRELGGHRTTVPASVRRRGAGDPSCRSRAAPDAVAVDVGMPSTCRGDAVVTSVLMRGRARKPSRSPPRTSKMCAPPPCVGRSTKVTCLPVSLSTVRYSRSSLLAGRRSRSPRSTARRVLELVQHTAWVRRSSSVSRAAVRSRVERMSGAAARAAGEALAGADHGVASGRAPASTNAGIERAPRSSSGEAYRRSVVDRGAGPASRGSAPASPPCSCRCARNMQGLLEDRSSHRSATSCVRASVSLPPGRVSPAPRGPPPASHDCTMTPSPEGLPCGASLADASSSRAARAVSVAPPSAPSPRGAAVLAWGRDRDRLRRSRRVRGPARHRPGARRRHFST
jgi:hypothetical protein